MDSSAQAGRQIEDLDSHSLVLAADFAALAPALAVALRRRQNQLSWWVVCWTRGFWSRDALVQPGACAAESLHPRLDPPAIAPARPTIEAHPCCAPRNAPPASRTFARCVFESPACRPVYEMSSGAAGGRRWCSALKGACFERLVAIAEDALQHAAGYSRQKIEVLGGRLILTFAASFEDHGALPESLPEARLEGIATKAGWSQDHRSKQTAQGARSADADSPAGDAAKPES